MKTGRTRAAAALVAAAFTAAALAALAAGATSSSAVKLTEATDSRFPDMSFIVSLPQKRPLTAAQLKVTENGQPVRDLSVARPGAEGVGVVLVIDSSDSMAGRPISGAMAAARTFAERRAPGQRIALVTFNSTTTVALPLTSDKDQITAALAGTPELATGTHIYDALVQAATLLENSGVSAGSIVLLSDGEDVGSTTSRETAIETLNGARTRVFTVGLNSRQFSPEALQEIAAGTGGTYAEASGAAGLKQIYSQLGYTLSNEYLLRYRSLASPDEKVRVAAKVNGIPGTARASYVSPALPTAAATREASLWDRIVQSDITLILLVTLVVSAIGYAIFKILHRPDQELTRRIGQFVTLPEDEKAKEKARQNEIAAALAVDSKRPANGFWERFKEDMAIAGIETPARTIALLTVFGGLAVGVFVAVFLGSPIGLLAAFAAPVVARWGVTRRLQRTRRLFSDQLPDNLDVLSSGLRAGHSFTGALAVCVDDAAEPSKSEFRRVIADEQLGISVDESLHVTARRMDSRDIVQVALVARLQREAGTNAADVLDQVSDNVRARLDLRRLIASLTAQGRMARWIVSLLPVFLFVAIVALNKGYIEVLWQEPVGIVGLIAAIVMIIVGSQIIKRIVDIEA